MMILFMVRIMKKLTLTIQRTYHHHHTSFSQSDLPHNVRLWRFFVLSCFAMTSNTAMIINIGLHMFTPYLIIVL